MIFNFRFHPMLLIVFLALLGQEIWLTTAKPAPSNADDFCHPCQRFVNFSHKVSNLIESDKEVRQTFIKRCQDDSAPEKMCKSIIDQLQSSFKISEPDHFCNHVDACSNSTLVLTSLEDDIDCDFCTNVVQKFKEVVTSNATENEIRKVIRSSCLNLKALRAQCDRFLDQDLDQLVRFVGKKLQPKKLCSELRFCVPKVHGDNSKVIKLPEIIRIGPVVSVPISNVPIVEESKNIESQVAKKPDPTCQMCEMVLKYVYKRLEQNKTQEKIIAELDHVCKAVFPTSHSRQKCDDFVQLHTEELINIVTHAINPHAACVMLGQCITVKVVPETQIATQTKELVNNAKNISCNDWQKAFECLYKEIAGNRTAIKIGLSLQKSCDCMEKNLTDACHHYLTNNVDILMESVLNEEDQRNVVTKLEFCDKSEVTTLKPSSNDCYLCKQLVSWILFKSGLGTNFTIEELKEKTNQVCLMMFKEGKQTECLAFMKAHEAIMVERLTNKLSTENTCSAMNLCEIKEQMKASNHISTVVNSSSLRKIMDSIQVPIPVETVVHEETSKSKSSGEREDVKPDECALCKKVMKQVQDLIASNSTAEAEKCLESVCQYLPEEMREGCKRFVDSKFDDIIKQLEAKTDPEEACKILRMCKAGVEPKLETENEVQSESDETAGKSYKFCWECEVVVRYLHDKFSDEKTMAKIEDFMKKHLCQKINATLNEKRCENFIKDYGTSVLETFASKVLKPAEICAKSLKLCPIHQEETASKSNSEDFVLVKAGRACELCETMVDSIKEEVVNATKKAAKIDSNIGDKVCKNMKNKKLCKEIFDGFGKRLVELSSEVESKSSQEICVSVDLCVVGDRIHMLGGEKCTFGPSYWCHTSAHAESCRAISYCRKNVWKAIE